MFKEILSGTYKDEEPTYSEGVEKVNARLFTILNSISDGIYITDGDANTIMVNKAYLEISGLDSSQVIGKNMKELVKNGIIDRSGTLEALKKKAPANLEQTFLTGKQALITSTPCFDEYGEISLIITIVRDMTDLYDLHAKCQETVERYKREIRQYEVFDSKKIIAVDPITIEVLRRAEKVAALNTTVLLQGETGVGKEQIARFLLENSNRAEENFISINCGAIPPNLIESELFGYERGAFTGANREGKMGVFEAANNGTVFLDEIGDLPLEMQVHLLRVLQDMKIKRVGSLRTIPVNVRVIAATNKDLKEMVKNKTFREDLYYRLNVVPITIAPLRQRREDIIPLVQFFLAEMNGKYNLQKRFAAAAMKEMFNYDWPGNVRELKNVVEQAVVLSAQEYILPSDLPISHMNTDTNNQTNDGIEVDLKRVVARLEHRYITSAYKRYGNVRGAAKSLGMTPATFVRKRQYGTGLFKE